MKDFWGVKRRLAEWSGNRRVEAGKLCHGKGFRNAPRLEGELTRVEKNGQTEGIISSTEEGTMRYIRIESWGVKFLK